MEDCIFCKINSGEISADIVYRDDDVNIFKDINPVAPVHLLGVLIKHITTVNELTEEDARLLGTLILKLKDVAQGYPELEKGYRIVCNCGRQSGQTVPHVHLHLLGGRRMAWPPG